MFNAFSFAATTSLLLIFATAADAKQCIRNKAGSAIEVTVYWYWAKDVSITQDHQSLKFKVTSPKDPFHTKKRLTVGRDSCVDKKGDTVAVVEQVGGKVVQDILEGATLTAITGLGAATCIETVGAGCIAAIAADGAVASTFAAIPDDSFIFYVGQPGTVHYLDVWGVDGAPKYGTSSTKID